MLLIDRLIEILCAERGESVPKLEAEQKPDYFRALCNVHPPMPVTAEFLALQDEYLTMKKLERGVTDVNDFIYSNGIALFKGDITTLNAEAVVNAANSAMLGCFHPLHSCIDNAIHSAAGVQVRLDCNDIMKGKQAKNGDVIVTKAYNLPSKFIFHTVGPVVQGKVTGQNERDLKNCYLNCLKKAAEMRLTNIAFCCISTGVFGYPKNKAATLAVQTVKEFILHEKFAPKVIFNVFTEEDYGIYNRILEENK